MQSSVPSPASAISITGLSYCYTHDWTRKRIQTLKDFSLEIHPGETFGFLGHNGAGKTTTIKCILNLIHPYSGQISIFGKSSKDPQARTPIGYLSEQPYFYDHLTVQETLEMYATLSGVPKSERHTAVKKTLERVGLSNRNKASMRSLSKGLTQRVALAQAIVHAPRVLILDEPFSGLDPIGRKEFRDLFLEAKKEGITIFMSSHILSDVEFLCDRVSILVRGELKGIYDLKKLPTSDSDRYELLIRSEGTEKAHLPQTLQSFAESIKFENKYIRLLFKDRHKAEQAMRATLEAGLIIESYEFVHGSLEDLFLTFVQGTKAS